MMTFYEALQGKYGLDGAEPPNQFIERSSLAPVSSMTQSYPCLLRIGKTSSKYRHFPFVQDQIRIGRAVDATYTILSTTISRCHAIISRQEDNTWTIMDNKSLNGIAVNGKKLKTLEPYILQDGDTVQLGVPAAPDAPSEFVYRFFASLKVRKEPRSKHARPGAEGGSPAKRFKGSEKTEEESRKEDEEPGKPGQGAEAERGRPEKEGWEEQEEQKAVYEKQLRVLAQQLQEKEAEKLVIRQQLQREREQRQAMEERQKLQEEKVQELDARQRQLVKEKAVAEEQMRRQLEEQLWEREELLRNQMQQQLASLAAEKSQVEERLQQEMEKAVLEKDRELQDRLKGEMDRLQKIIETKELEQKTLENQLAESRVENEKARADTLTTREAILSEFAETMETELQCSICSELLVKATSLNCSHAFCALCIRQWLGVKNECPNCRTAVTSQMRSIVLDNYIDRMVEQLSEEMKQRRCNLVAERKAAEAKLDEAGNKQKAGPSGAAARGRGRQRGGARGRGRGRRARGAAPAAPVAPVRAGVVEEIQAILGVGPPAVAATITNDSVDAPSVDNAAGAEPILVSDAESEVITDSEEDEEDSENMDDFLSDEFDRYDRYRGSDHSDSEMNSDEDEDYVRGTGAYFGGFGRCFRCGARGHWANGCPNR